MSQSQDPGTGLRHVADGVLRFGCTCRSGEYRGARLLLARTVQCRPVPVAAAMADAA